MVPHGVFGHLQLWLAQKCMRNTFHGFLYFCKAALHRCPNKIQLIYWKALIHVLSQAARTVVLTVN